MSGHHHHDDDDPSRTSVQHVYRGPHYVAGFGPACYEDHALRFWAVLPDFLRELREELRPEALAARIDAWVERQKR